MATQQPLTRFSGDPDDPVQPATFLQDFEVRMTELMTPRADLAGRIKPYLERDSRAWEWYTKDLTATDRTGTWEAFEAKFHARFPSQKKEKKSAKSYSPVWKGNKLHPELTHAKRPPMKHLPYTLKKVIDEEHDNWAEFTSAIKAVKWSVLKVEAEHEASKAVPMVVPETPRTKLASSFATARISAPPLPSPIRMKPAYTTSTGNRKPRRTFTALDEGRKGVLRRGIAAKAQHPNMPEGLAAWKTELLEWASRYRVDGALSEGHYRAVEAWN
ncbi:retrotransposon-like family member (retr-1) partial [Lentinula edodes]|uniref:Retrotransposon-like family member (Retr-1) partial n=1 Tax=Lentinula edodes TaxID=5353 RepID=A0A1Q3EI17_LENED|nr:retrotransposon-like family member (retr-1) partial [Lentinula edodes]